MTHDNEKSFVIQISDWTISIFPSSRSHVELFEFHERNYLFALVGEKQQVEPVE